MCFLRICIIFLALMNVAVAGENTGFRSIVDIGCHRIDGTCYLTLDGSPFVVAGSSCNLYPNMFRFSTDDTNGKRAYMSLLAAYLAGKKVSLYANGCYINQPNFQTFDWFNIGN